jgi:hypothetical protein
MDSFVLLINCEDCGPGEDLNCEGGEGRGDIRTSCGF